MTEKQMETLIEINTRIKDLWAVNGFSSSDADKSFDFTMKKIEQIINEYKAYQFDIKFEGLINEE